MRLTFSSTTERNRSVIPTPTPTMLVSIRDLLVPGSARSKGGTSVAFSHPYASAAAPRCHVSITSDSPPRPPWRGVCATVTATTVAAPASRSALAPSSSVAPVVTTSSTSTTGIPATGPATKAPPTLRRRASRSRPRWSSGVRRRRRSRRSRYPARRRMSSTGRYPRRLRAARVDGTVVISASGGAPRRTSRRAGARARASGVRPSSFSARTTRAVGPAKGSALVTVRSGASTRRTGRGTRARRHPSHTLGVEGPASGAGDGKPEREGVAQRRGDQRSDVHAPSMGHPRRRAAARPRRGGGIAAWGGAAQITRWCPAAPPARGCRRPRASTSCRDDCRDGPGRPGRARSCSRRRGCAPHPARSPPCRAHRR